MKVTYLEGDEDDETELPTGEKSIYTGQVVNCDLEKMLIHMSRRARRIKPPMRAASPLRRLPRACGPRTSLPC